LRVIVLFTTLSIPSGFVLRTQPSPFGSSRLHGRTIHLEAGAIFVDGSLTTMPLSQRTLALILLSLIPVCSIIFALSSILLPYLWLISLGCSGLWVRAFVLAALCHPTAPRSGWYRVQLWGWGGFALITGWYTFAIWALAGGAWPF
jgi:hypothetical protein